MTSNTEQKGVNWTENTYTNLNQQSMAEVHQWFLLH